MKVGFIGLGTMGAPMAKCLIHDGFDLLGWDTNEETLLGFDSAAESLEQIAQCCDSFITMLPEGQHVRSVYEQLLGQIETPHLFMDCSTIDVASTRGLAMQLTALGHGFVDAPVSGGREAASSGSLSFMIGGDAEHVDAARPLLASMGKKLIEFGDAGTGQAAKACHNMICGITALGVSEAFALADALELDLDRFFHLCSGAAAQSWILENRCPVPGPALNAPASSDYTPGFAAYLMAKDLELAQQAAEASNQQTEFGAAAARRFREFVEAGYGDLDFSAIYRSIRN